MPEPQFGDTPAPDAETPATLERRRRPRGPAASELRRFSIVGSTTSNIVPLDGAASRPTRPPESTHDTTAMETLRAERLERARRNFDFGEVEDADRCEFNTLLDAYEQCLYVGMDTDELNDYLYRAYVRWDDGLAPRDPRDVRE